MVLEDPALEAALQLNNTNNTSEKVGLSKVWSNIVERSFKVWKNQIIRRRIGKYPD